MAQSGHRVFRVSSYVHRILDSDMEDGYRGGENK
jgi:hypothetical protein